MSSVLDQLQRNVGKSHDMAVRGDKKNLQSGEGEKG